VHLMPCYGFFESGGTKYYGRHISPLESCFKVKFKGESGYIPSTAKVATSRSFDLVEGKVPW
jgi:hypothetical protein